ncbi:MAG: FG-GAP-like repeat-containing protein [Planctomycetota bacterium]
MESRDEGTASIEISVDERMELAIAFATDEKFDAAIRELKQLLLIEPTNSKAIFLLARCQAGIEKIDDAIETLGSIPIDDPEFGIPAIGQRAEYLSGLGRVGESIPAWRQLVERMPTLDQARSALAFDLYRSGRRIEACNELQKLAERGRASDDELRRLLNATNPPPSRRELMLRAKRADVAKELVGLNAVWDAIQKRKYRDALEFVRAMKEPKPTQAEVLHVWLLTELHEFDEAAMQLRTLSGDAAEFPSFWLAVGSIHESGERYDQALAAYERAMSLDPTREVTHDRLAGMLLRTGRLREARAVDERRFALAGPAEAVLAIGPGQPDDAAASQSMVDDLIRLGRPIQAAAWLERLAPRHATIFGDSTEVKKRAASLRQSHLDQRRAVWSGGLLATDLPDPTLPKSSSNERNLSESGKQQPVASNRDIQFRSSAQDLEIEFQYRNATKPKQRVLRLFEQIGGGVIAFDYDRDGDADLYFAQAACEPGQVSNSENVLLRNDGSKFTRIPRAIQIANAYTHGVTYGDWNQDGFWDIAIGNFGANQLLINQGDGTFLDRSDWITNGDPQMTASLAIADVNGDSLPDWVEVNYVDDPSVFGEIPVTSAGYPSVFVGPNKFRSAEDGIGISDVEGKATLVPLSDPSVTEQELQSVDASSDASAGSEIPRIGDAAQPGLGLMITDLDGRPGLECFVANDSRPNQCWQIRTEGDSVASDDIAMITGLATSGAGETTACMGIAAADFNRDGREDLVVTNWYDEWSNLYEQSEGGSFADRAPRYGLDLLSDRHVGFGMVAEDFNQDGWIDLLVGNGHVDDFSHQGIPQEMPMQVLQNIGAKFELAVQSDPFFSYGHVTRCVVSADLNRDGRMDVVATDLVDPAYVLLNESDNARWIQLTLVATEQERSAVGARAEISGSSWIQSRTLPATAGYMGRGEAVLHFGLEEKKRKLVDAMVTWPDGSTEVFRDLEADRRHLLIQNQSSHKR